MSNKNGSSDAIRRKKNKYRWAEFCTKLADRLKVSAGAFNTVLKYLNKNLKILAFVFGVYETRLLNGQFKTMNDSLQTIEKTCNDMDVLLSNININ